MSETYEKQKNQVSMLEIVLMSVAGLISAPLLLFVILYMFLILKTDRKENFVLYPCIAFLAVIFGKLEQFFTQTIQITVTLIKGILNGKFAISAYGNYSLSSWLILTSLAFAVASYAVKRIRYNRKKRASGEIAEQAAARFATIAESEIGGILSEDGIDIYTALNEGAVILFVLNPLLFPETSQAFGRLVLIDAKKAVSKLYDMEIEIIGCFVWVTGNTKTVMLLLFDNFRNICFCISQKSQYLYCNLLSLVV